MVSSFSKLCAAGERDIFPNTFLDLERVAMGRAIVREPQAFLMDEPLSNLDAKLRVSMRAALNQLHERSVSRPST